MERDQVFLIISKYLSGEVTAAESQQLHSWIHESEENNRLFTEISRVWNISLESHYTVDEITNQILMIFLNGLRFETFPPASGAEELC